MRLRFAPVHGLLFLLASQTGCASGNTSSEVSRLERGPQPEVRTLRNGMQVVVVHDERQPIVAIALVVGAGAAKDPPARAGLAHLLEHLSFQARAADGATLKDRMRAWGVVENGYTGFDHASFLTMAQAGLWREIVATQLARLADPLSGIDESDFRHELDVVRSEIGERAHQEGLGAGLAWLQQAIYDPEDPYSGSVGGTRATLASLTLADARAFATSHYRPSQATLYLDGALPPEIWHELEDLLPAAFAPEPAVPAEPMATSGVRLSPRVNTHPAVERHEDRANAPELWVGWPLPSPLTRGGALVALVAHLAAKQLDSDWFHAVAPGVIDTETQLIEGVRGSLLVCRARLLDGADPERVTKVIKDNVASLWATQVPVAASQRQRRIAIEHAFLETQESLFQRARSWPVAARFTGEPRFVLRDMAETLRDLHPLDMGDYISQQLSPSRARAVFVKPASPATKEPSVATVGTRAAPAAAPQPSRPFPATPQELAALLGASAIDASAQVLANGLTAIAIPRRGDVIATVLLGFHDGTGTAAPAGVAEVSAVASLFAVNDMLCGSLDRCGVRQGPNLLYKDATANLYRSDVATAAHVLDIISQTQQVDWVQWPNDGLAPRYRAFRRIHDQAPDVKVARMLDEALYPKQRWGIAPRIEDLEHIDERAVRSWTDAHRGARNTAVIVVGDLDAVATLEKIKRAFSSWIPGTAAAARGTGPSSPQHSRPTLAEVNWAGASQAYLSFACQLPAATPANDAWQGLLAQVIEHALDQVLREQMGISYGASVAHRAFRNGASDLVGQFMVSGQAARQATVEVGRIIATLAQGNWPLPAAGTEVGGDALATALRGERWEYLTRQMLALGTSDGLARKAFLGWNLGWPLDGGRTEFLSLAEVDVGGLASLARQCGQTAVIAVAVAPEYWAR
jgi:zinc protease